MHVQTIEILSRPGCLGWWLRWLVRSFERRLTPEQRAKMSAQMMTQLYRQQSSHEQTDDDQEEKAAPPKSGEQEGRER